MKAKKKVDTQVQDKGPESTLVSAVQPEGCYATNTARVSDPLHGWQQCDMLFQGGGSSNHLIVDPQFHLRHVEASEEHFNQSHSSKETIPTICDNMYERFSAPCSGMNSNIESTSPLQVSSVMAPRLQRWGSKMKRNSLYIESFCHPDDVEDKVPVSTLVSAVQPEVCYATNTARVTKSEKLLTTRDNMYKRSSVSCSGINSYIETITGDPLRVSSVMASRRQIRGSQMRRTSHSHSELVCHPEDDAGHEEAIIHPR
jgi:hypothetical protein